jgi:hypothetical protein
VEDSVCVRNIELQLPPLSSDGTAPTVQAYDGQAGCSAARRRSTSPNVFAAAVISFGCDILAPKYQT